MALYDFNSALQPYSFGQSASAGLWLAGGIQQLQDLASKRRNTMALSRAMRGDMGAMADINDPEMLAQAQRFQRQQALRGFYNPVDQNVVGINTLETIANAKPRGFDVQGAVDYMVSQGAGADEIGPLLKLAELRKPDSSEYFGGLTPTDQGYVAMTKRGPVLTSYRPAEKMQFVGGRAVRLGPSGEIAGMSDLPMTQQEQLRASAEQERLAMERERLRLEQERANKPKQDMTPYQRIQLEGGLRDDFRADSKTYDEIRRQHGLITTALKDKSAAGTLAAATSFMKMLDPGSVVRESELGMALASTGVTDRIMNYANVIQSGKVLTEQQRNEFASLTNEFLRAAQAEHDKRKNFYRQTATEYGLNPSRIIGRDEQQPKSQPRSIAPAATWLKSRNLQTQQQFNTAVQQLRQRGWSEAEIRQAVQEAGL